VTEPADTAADPADTAAEAPESPTVAGRSRGLVVTLVAVIAVAALAAAVAIGHAWGRDSSGSGSAPGTSSVDAGFARDMSTHHRQAITMAGYARDNTADPAVKVLAYDIETSQYFQVGEMQGWLDTWGVTHNSTDPMGWMASSHMTMGSDGLMPGMATPDQMSKLESLHGKALDILFLQLMIHHHQGGLPMAKYAQQHAGEPYVRSLAQSMINAQSGEIVLMEQMLRKLGASPLPAPDE
jgi:uncharacterized protein (DUF305 family)